MNLSEYLYENIVNESSAWKAIGPTFSKGFDMSTITVKPNKEYGFVCYNEDTESVHLIAVDSKDDIVNALSVDPDMFEEIFKLKVGQVDRDPILGSLTMRIW